VGRLCGKAKTEPCRQEARRLQRALPCLFQGEEPGVNGPLVAAQVGEEEEEEEEVAAAVGDLMVAFEENLFLFEDEEVEEHDRPVTPPAQIQATGLLTDDAPPSSKLDSFVIEERKEVLSVVSWNPLFSLPEQA